MLEDKFHLDFARLFRSRLHEEALRLYTRTRPTSSWCTSGGSTPCATVPSSATAPAGSPPCSCSTDRRSHASLRALFFRAHAKRTMRQVARAALAEARRPFAVAASLVVAGCGTVSTNHMPYAPPVPDIAFVVPAAPYRIRIGDTLSIRLPLSPELDEEVTVRPDGGISATLDPDDTPPAARCPNSKPCSTTPTSTS